MSERIRKGMWVRYSDRVGIVAELMQNTTGTDSAELHLVDSEGVTETVVIVSQAAIAQAAFEDIPVCRRPTPDVAHNLGYL